MDAGLVADVAVARRDAVVRASLAVAAGEVLALVGPSGAGKTTVLHAIAGLVRPCAGRVAVGGATWSDADRGVFVAPERRRVGLVFQEGALFPHLDARANVAFPLEADGVGRAERRRRADELLGRLGIAALADVRPGAMSGGERQRVALARALARDPAVLLLDEPLASLDSATRSLVRAELAAALAPLAIPVVLVTHDPGDADALAVRTQALHPTSG